MSKQLHYIISAFLLLIAITGLFLFIKTITFDRSTQTERNEILISMAAPDSISSPTISKGKNLFQSKCASCHNIFKTGTGPALSDLEDRHKWANKEELYRWIKNPAAYMKDDAYTKQLKEQYGSMMTAFPDLTNEEIDAIMEYIRNAGQAVNKPMPVASR